MQHPEMGSPQLSLGDSIAPRPVNVACPCPHLLCRPWAPQGARCLCNTFPDSRSHLLPGQRRVSRGCRHGDDSANEGRCCPMMLARFLVQEWPLRCHRPPPLPFPHAPHSSVQDLSPQAPVDLQEALPCFPGDCKAAADGLDIYKLSFTNDLYSPKTAAQRDASLLKVI